jgi:hypothetical protein
MAKLKKIREERMFMLDRKRGHDKENYPQEQFDIAGSVGFYSYIFRVSQFTSLSY